MKLTKSRLRQLIQEELQAVLREQTEEDLSYLSGLESGMSPGELNLLSLGLDPNLAPPKPKKELPKVKKKEKRPLGPPKLPSATMTTDWGEQVDANKAKEKAKIGWTEGWLKDDEEARQGGPSEEGHKQSQGRKEMERGSTRHGTRK